MEKIFPVHILENPSYITPYEFEKRFDLQAWRTTAGKNWKVSVYVSAFYVSLIFAIQFLMKNRQPFKLTKTLTTWNCILAVFSTMAFLRTAPEFFHVLTSANGFHNTVCKWYGNAKFKAEIVVLVHPILNHDLLSYYY